MRIMGVSEQEYDNTDISTVVRQMQYYDVEQQVLMKASDAKS